jgi:hypothetical protein
MATYLMELWLWKAWSPFANPSCRQMHNHTVIHYLDGGPPPRKFGERGAPIIGRQMVIFHCHFLQEGTWSGNLRVCQVRLSFDKNAKCKLSYVWHFPSWGPVFHKLWLEFDFHGFEKLAHGITWIQVGNMLTIGHNMGLGGSRWYAVPCEMGSNKKASPRLRSRKTFPKKYIWV